MVNKGTKVIEQPLEFSNSLNICLHSIKLQSDISILFFICFVLKHLFSMERLTLPFDAIEVILVFIESVPYLLLETVNIPLGILELHRHLLGYLRCELVEINVYYIHYLLLVYLVVHLHLVLVQVKVHIQLHLAIIPLSLLVS